MRAKGRKSPRLMLDHKPFLKHLRKANGGKGVRTYRVVKNLLLAVWIPNSTV